MTGDGASHGKIFTDYFCAQQRKATHKFGAQETSVAYGEVLGISGEVMLHSQLQQR
jgi:hypothetical protein